MLLMLSVFVSQEIYLASLGGDGNVKDNVYRMMFAVMTNEVGRTFNWSGKHGWRGEADMKREKFQGTHLCRVVTRKCMMLIHLSTFKKSPKVFSGSVRIEDCWAQLWFLCHLHIMWMQTNRQRR